ncbi:MAG TPA: succinate dehydrogenase assembly factor 2 [Rhodocyclaceae bacterium]|jgi:antitoxin CptB
MDEAKRARIGRLKWHCRRALLELDIVFTRFWELQGDDLDEETEASLTRLLALEDHDVWDLVNGRASIDDPELTAFAGMLRSTCIPEPVKH